MLNSAGLGRLPAAKCACNSGATAMAARPKTCSGSAAVKASRRLALPNSCSRRAWKLRGVNSLKSESRPAAKVAREKPSAAGPRSRASLRSG